MITFSHHEDNTKQNETKQNIISKVSEEVNKYILKIILKKHQVEVEFNDDIRVINEWQGQLHGSGCFDKEFDLLQSVLHHAH